MITRSTAPVRLQAMLTSVHMMLRSHQIRMSARLATLSALIATAACGGRAGDAPSQAAAAPAADQQEAAETRDGMAPRAQVRCITPEPDSATAVAAAVDAVADPLALRVSSFVRHPDGALVSLVPRSPEFVGGGGLVWVDRDGCITLIKRSE